MQYLITFLEGVISFISPCMLPMLPIYISYFAGSADKKQSMIARAAAFVAGFTVVFTALGLFAGTLSVFLTQHQTAVNLVTGGLVILFGLSYLEIIPLPFFKGMQTGRKVTSLLSAFLFGAVYSVSLTPCVGAFLGSALALASASGGAWKGASLLLVYSLGLGIPFLLSAVLIDKLGGAFRFIKAHYKVINTVCGVFLIAVGIAMAAGWLGAMLTLLT